MSQSYDKTLLKPFQIEDLARAAVHDGCILAWEQGLGKSLAAVAFPIIKQAQRTLIVAPGSLHQQLRISAAKFFNRSLHSIATPEDFYRLRLHKPHKGSPRFYITTYTALGLNGGDEWPIGFGQPGVARVSKTLRSRRKAQAKALKLKFDDENVGESSHGITCVFSPTLARIAQGYDSFDCVVVDEGTRLQATESRIGASLRILNPAYRLVLTGTPIKNRLESIFWLASWTAGPYGRWPFKPTEAERERFASTFLQSERFVSREEAMVARGIKTYNTTRRSNRICSIHKLWKTLSPVIIRRRKQDCGEAIVAKIMKPVIVQPGTSQQAVYRYHLDNPPVIGRKSKKAMHRRVQIGVQLSMLRIASLCPDSDTLSESITGVSGPRKSWTCYTPKMDAILDIVRTKLGEGKQVIVGSPYRDFSNRLDEFLKAAGVTSIVLDGDTNPAERGDLAQQFKRGQHSVLIAGIKAMGEGHSFENCSDLILSGLTYAYDENEQFIHRVWRMTSKHPVNIYPVIMSGSIDERLHEIFSEKSSSAAMAIDRLLQDADAEIDFEKLLEETISTFNPTASTIDEEKLLAAWDSFGIKRLRTAQMQYNEHHNAGDPQDRKQAVDSLMIPSPTQITVDILRKHYKNGTFKKPTSLSLKTSINKLKKRR
jgi:SNF2 family DNA or RNA helicase